jgi:hypothetical protein
MDCENVHSEDSGAPQKQPEEAHDLSSLNDWVDEMTDEKTPAWRSGRGWRLERGKIVSGGGGMLDDSPVDNSRV